MYNNLCSLVKKNETLQFSRGYKIREEVVTAWSGSVWGANAPLRIISSRRLPLDEELQRDLLE